MESRCSLMSASPFYGDIVHTSSSPSRSTLRLAEVSTNSFVENPDYKERVLSTPHNYESAI